MRAMQDNRMPEEISPVIGREAKAEIVDRLYEVALDPIRLEDLLEVWEGRVAPHRTGHSQAVVTLDDPEIEAHLRRATVFLDRFEATRDVNRAQTVLEEIPRSAAFLADGGAGIAGFNRAAGVAFGLKDGAVLADLPFDEEDVALLRTQIARVASGRAERAVTLRIRSTITGSPVIVRVGAVDRVAEADARPLALVISTELVWPEGFEATVQEAFGLTLAEMEIVRGIALGLPVREIAEARGRSPETVRTQLRSILAKTETHSQSELVRVVLGLMDVAQIAPVEMVQPASTSLAVLPVMTLRTAEGRRLEWVEFGDPKGAPVLYMHLDLGLSRWPAPAERAARQRGIRVIVPHRAGFGRSDLHGKGADYTEAVARDYLAVLDHLGITRAAILSQGADFRYACALSLLRPGLVTGILGCAAQLPLRHAAQYDRMDKWQRFILANARYAPKVLPFLVQAGYSLARRLGKEKFFTLVNGGSAADMAAFARPEIREAVLVGSEIALGAKISAHQAFTREALSSEKDWSKLVQAVRVPVLLLQGDQDPQTPVQTVRELMADFPHLEVTFLPDTGQLLLFAEWQVVLDRLGRFLPAR
ncbi:LuxR C-terminal-related transcriptional regulator [Tabrizicola oligotrophica]|uniref:Alpha/beta fold hydrolase n=1 Tax=Tabrizicola oligotrophica TaxID=2710650 RepID=A0A6M0QYC0_9RHOB|nr:LuxR C-terminal-related transcriptional regulator [Tabrizicola oligotrophica]NEY91971.1 alpha/beta fold hydrolase [Tabrizicola oligotrophica]